MTYMASTSFCPPPKFVTVLWSLTFRLQDYTIRIAGAVRDDSYKQARS